jgi:hypothetical protein
MSLGQPTAAVIGKGTTLGYNTSATAGPTGTYTAIAEITDLVPPTRTATPVKVERYDSPTLEPELIPSWSEPGDVTFKLTYAKAMAATLATLYNVTASYQITKTDSSTKTVVGIMTQLGEELPLKTACQNTVKISISGSATDSTGSA